MRTSEFISISEKLGYEIEELGKRVLITDEGEFLISVDMKERFIVDSDKYAFQELEDNEKSKLFALCMEYASTPISEREEEKRYRLKLVNKTVDDNASYLNKIESEGKYFVSNKFSIFGKVESIFTESELAEMDETGFERIEVEQ